MNIKLSHTFLPADDPDEAIAFYRDIIGLEVRTDVGSGKIRWVTVGSPDQPEVGIVLHPPAANPNLSAEDHAAIADLMAKGIYATMVFWTDNCDETFDRISAAGVDVLQEPIDQGWGIRDCAFRDPFGNHLRFNQSKN